MQDVNQALVLLHLALYEIHLDLLKRSVDYTNRDTSSNPLFTNSFENQNNGDFTVSQVASHKLTMANDVMSLKGNDTAVGDSATLYIQIDSVSETFLFEEIDVDVAESLASVLSDILRKRQDELDEQVSEELDISLRLSDDWIAALSIADVPFYLSIGNDKIDLWYNQATAVGDFATLGVLFSDDPNPSNVPCPGNCLHPYIASIINLRKKPSVYSFLPRLSLYGTDFFYQRFDAATAKKYEPIYHGDTFTAHSSRNLVIGDYLDAATFDFIGLGGGVPTIYVHGEGAYDNYEWMAEPMVTLSASAYYEGQKLPWAEDTIMVVGNAQPFWRDQKSSNTGIVIGKTQTVDFTDPFIESSITKLFFNQDVTEQLTTDTYRISIPYEISRDISMGSACRVIDNVFMLPLHTRSPYLRIIQFETRDGQTPSPTVSAMPSIELDLIWYPYFEDYSCHDDGNQVPTYMVLNYETYLFTSAEACCRKYFQWEIQDCRKKVSMIICSSVI